MLTSNSKVYYVYIIGGEYEDRYEQGVGVCATIELAEQLKEQIESEINKEPSISYEVYSEMINSLYDYEEEHDITFDDDIEGLLMIFPEYTREELEIAERKYDYFEEQWVYIKELNFYN